MTTFLVRLDPPPGDGPRLAVKDLVDVVGTPTTCASRPVAAMAEPAAVDAACVAIARAAGARIVGKVNLHELAFGGSGINPWTGTPVNPLDPTRIPGGSSSGSAVAVATGEADVAIGTDTAGSIRTPAACCGVVGLKTTYGRIPVEGVRPLAPSLDTVGPMAADVAGVAVGMALLEPGFVPAAAPASALGRVRLGAAAWVEDAVDRLLAACGMPVAPVELPGWDAAELAGTTVLFGESARTHARLLAEHGDQLGDETRDRLVRGAAITDDELAAALGSAPAWRDELGAALRRTPVLVTAGIMDEPAPLDDPLRLDTRRLNVAVNLAGVPALVLPVPAGGRFPAAVQLIAATGAEELLVASALVLEAAAATLA
ncbi:MAG TPA: amidase [Acidimicrobiales bacterium]|nr:amidase [Acidimicrobiales bacterium]